MASVIYNSFFSRMANDSLGGMASDQHKIALMSAGYTANKDHATWASISGSETSGASYTSGGKTLGGISITKSDASDWVYMDATDVNWASLTLSAAGAVIYNDTHANDALVCFLSFGTLKSPSAQSLTIQFSTGGIIRWYQG